MFQVGMEPFLERPEDNLQHTVETDCLVREAHRAVLSLECIQILN